MTDRTDTSDEACALICMYVSNPQGVMRQDGDGWQRRVNDLIRALRDERNALRDVVSWVETWTSNPVGSYSVDALDGLFGMTRDKIAALQSADPGQSAGKR